MVTLSKNCPHIAALEVTVVVLQGFDDPFSESNSSKLTDVPAVEFLFSGTLFLGQQEQLLSWKQLDTYNYFHCGYVRMILDKMVVACFAGAQSRLIPGSIHCRWVRRSGS